MTRELGDAAPQAAPSRDLDNDLVASPRGVASRLISEHRYLIQAPPHFRAAMVRRLVRAVEAGLDERHLARALARVVGHANRDAHCELVRLGVQQAWADQRGGTCPECAGDGRGVEGHAFACSARAAGVAHDDEGPEAIRAAIVASLDTVRATRTTGTTSSCGESSSGFGLEVAADDPLQPFLDEDVPPPAVLDWATSSEEDLVRSLSVLLARLVTAQPPSERVRALQRAWARTRPRVPRERWDLLDLAALRLRQRLEQQAGQANSRVAS